MKNVRKLIASTVSVILTIALLVCNVSAYSLISDASNRSNPLSMTEAYEGISYGKELIQNCAQQLVQTYVMRVDIHSDNISIVTGVPNDSTPLTPGTVQTTTGMARAAENNGANVLAAVNGDYFMQFEPTMIQPNGITIKDGVVLREYNNFVADRTDFFGIKSDGSAVIGDKTVFDSVKDDLVQAVGGGPWIVKNGIVQDVGDKRHPRTGVGITADGDVMFAVTDGRNALGDGLTFVEMGQYMRDLGCVDVVLLDGGGSCTMALKNTSTGNFDIKNVPSDGAERPMGDCLLILGPNTVKYTATVCGAETQHNAGDSVQLSAIPVIADGTKYWRFSGWESSVEGAVDNPALAETYFTMPSCNITISEADRILIGDANGDNAITSSDVLVIKRYIVGFINGINPSFDINNDTNADSSDILMLKRMIVGLYEPAQ